MRQAKLIVVATISLILLGSSISTFAQEDNRCPSLVQSALETVEMVCDAVVSNQACYGHVQVSANFIDSSLDTLFSVPGDLTELAHIDTLRLSALDESANEWGIAFMRAQANLPDTLPGQQVTFVLFGDVAVDAVPPIPQLPAVVSAANTVNIRSGPGTTYEVISTVGSGSSLIANGHNSSTDWLRVTLPDRSQPGWIAASLMEVEQAADTLAIVTPDDPINGPMQAFYLRSGVGGSACAEAPPDGLLIQTPQGAGEIDFFINEVHIRLGSTAYVQAPSGDSLMIYLLEGQAEVTVGESSQTVPEGSMIVIPLDDDSRASTLPNTPEPYDRDSLLNLPTSLLPEPIEIAQPATLQAITRANACQIFPRGTANVRQGPGTNYPIQVTLDESARRTVWSQVLGQDGFVWWNTSGTVDLWIRSDLVTNNGRCADVPTVAPEDLPAAPTPAPVTATDNTQPSAPFQSSYHCREQVITVPANRALVLYFGHGRWASPEDAAYMMTVANGSMSYNGAPLPLISFEPNQDDTGAYGMTFSFQMDPLPPGTHVTNISISDPGGPVTIDGRTGSFSTTDICTLIAQ